MVKLIATKTAETALSPHTGGDGPDPSLDTETVRGDTDSVVNAFRMYAKLKGYKTDRSLQSAMFHMSMFIDDGSGRKSYYMNRVMSLDGWHGSGKGNRFYGAGYLILTLWGGNGAGQEFRVLETDTIHHVGRKAYFVSAEAKAKYRTACANVVQKFGQFEQEALVKLGLAKKAEPAPKLGGAAKKLANGLFNTKPVIPTKPAAAKKTAPAPVVAPAPAFAIDEKVKAIWPGDGYWYNGVVKKLLDGKADIEWEDGSKSRNVPFKNIKSRKRK